MQTETVQLHQLSDPGLGSLGHSLYVIDFPGLSGDKAPRDEAMACHYLMQIAVVVVDSGLVGSVAREDVRHALHAVGISRKQNVRMRHGSTWV